MSGQSKEITVVLDYSLPGTIDEVYQYLANPVNDEEWQSSCDKVTLKNPDAPIQQGTEYIIHFAFLSRKMNFEAQVSEYEKNKRYAYETLSGPLRYQGHYTFEPTESEVKIHWVFTATPGKFFGIIPHNLIRKTLIKRVSEDVERLKERFSSWQQVKKAS